MPRGSAWSAAKAKAAFTALTDRRLIFVHTRVGAFKPLLENIGVTSIERENVKGVHIGKSLIFELGDGAMLEYQNNRSSKHISAQNDFFAQLESTIPRSDNAAKIAGSKQKWNMAATVLGIALAALYLLYRFAGS